MHLDAVQAVFVEPGAAAAADGLQVDELPSPPRIPAREVDAGVGAVAGRGDPLRDGRRQRPGDQIHHSLTGLAASVHRRRRLAVQDASERRRDSDRTVEPGVRQDVGVDKSLQRVIAGRVEAGPDDVHACPHLRWIAGEIEGDLVTRDGDGDPQFELLVQFGAVEPVGEGVVAVGELRDRSPSATLGVVEQFSGHLDHGLAPVASAELVVAIDRGVQGGLLSTEIGTAFFGDLAVQQDQLQQFLLQHTAPDEVHRRNPDRLLEDVLVAPVAEVGVVGQGCRPGGQLTRNEDRGSEHDVGQVRTAAGVGIVADEDIPLGDVLGGDAVPDGPHYPHQRAQVQRRAALVLSDRVTVGVEEAGGAVASFLDVRRECRLDQGLAHLLDDARQRRRDHLHQDRILGRRPGHGCAPI